MQSSSNFAYTVKRETSPSQPTVEEAEHEENPIIGEPPRKVRRRQASCLQKEKLLIGMEENWKILSCSPKGPDQRAKHREAWERLTHELNSMAPHDGPWKTADEWKKVWMDMKYFAMTKKRAQAAAEGKPVYYSGRHAKIIKLSMADGKESGQISGNSSGINGFDSTDDSMNNDSINEAPPMSPTPVDPLQGAESQYNVTLQENLKTSPASFRAESPEVAEPEPQESHNQSFSLTLTDSSKNNQQQMYEVLPPEPYTLREMQFYHLLKKAREERDFFKTEFVIMREMMQDAMKLLKEKQ